MNMFSSQYDQLPLNQVNKATTSYDCSQQTHDGSKHKGALIHYPGVNGK